MPSDPQPSISDSAQTQIVSEAHTEPQTARQDTPITSFVIPPEILALQRQMNIGPTSVPAVQSPAAHPNQSLSASVPPLQRDSEVDSSSPLPEAESPTELHSSSMLETADGTAQPMGPPTIVPAKARQELKREAISASISKAAKKSAGFKPIGFKPIGAAKQTSSSLKRFFPGEEEDPVDEKPIADIPPPFISSVQVHPLLMDAPPVQEESYLSLITPSPMQVDPSSTPQKDLPEQDEQSAADSQSVSINGSNPQDLARSSVQPRKQRSSLSTEVFPDDTLNSKQDTTEAAGTRAPLETAEASSSTTKPSKSHRDSKKDSSKGPSAELYTIVSQVGEGTFGKVYKAQNTISKLFVALKRIRMENERDGFPVTAMREIKLLQSLRHPNVVRLYEMMVSNGKFPSVFIHSLSRLTCSTQRTFTWSLSTWITI